jgi:NADPH:quinone reductase-like Zn-dependent oxidoreductase
MSLAVTYTHTGEPADVLRVTDVADPPPPGPSQIQVRITAFPIHPGDLLFISTPRTLDGAQLAGSEATGVVTGVGSAVDGFRTGTRVAFFPQPGAWSEVLNVDAALAVAVPDAVTDDTAAQMVCNPLTVVLLRRAAEQHFGVGFGQVVINNAAASSVGRLFTGGAEFHHIDTISVVRSEQRAQQLRERFPDVPVVTTSHPDWPDRLREAAAGRPLPVALDPVGGAGASDLLSMLSPGGTLIIYGQLAAEPMTVPASTLLHTGQGIRGMTINRWFTAVSPEERASDVASAIAITTNLPQHFEVAGAYPLDRIADAVRHAAQPGKIGTVVVHP